MPVARAHPAYGSRAVRGVKQIKGCDDPFFEKSGNRTSNNAGIFTPFGQSVSRIADFSVFPSLEIVGPEMKKKRTSIHANGESGVCLSRDEKRG